MRVRKRGPRLRLWSWRHGLLLGSGLLTVFHCLSLNSLSIRSVLSAAASSSCSLSCCPLVSNLFKIVKRRPK